MDKEKIKKIEKSVYTNERAKYFRERQKKEAEGNKKSSINIDK